MNDRFKFRTPILEDDGKFLAFHFSNALEGVDNYRDVGPWVKGKLEQCTGLKDNSGQLIYEGDLLLLDPDDPPALVVWNEDVAMFCLEQEDVSYTFDNCGYSSQEMEVIGNIHENPELLEDK